MPGAMRYFGLVDRRFAGPSAVSGVTPKTMKWERDLASFTGPVFFSHEKMLESDPQLPRSLKFGLLHESEAIAKDLYRDVERVMNDFSLVFTHSARLLRKYSHARWIPGGGCWVGGKDGGGLPPKVFDKSRNISIVTSSKKMVRDHVLRYRVAEKMEHQCPGADVYRMHNSSNGPSMRMTTGGVSTPIDFPVSPLQYLKDYRFSVVVENNQTDHYFTEKLLNCFATGTVPVYRGAKKIDRLFDVDGIIPWTSQRELFRRVLPKLNEDSYFRRLGAIQNNFRSFSTFSIIEDYIVATYGEEIERLSSPTSM